MLVEQPEGGGLDFPVFVAGTDDEVELGLVDVDVNFRCIVKLENILIFITFQ